MNNLPVSNIIVISKRLPKWQVYIMIIPGLIYIFEFHHLVKALTLLSYYPGLITGISFPFIGFFYWKQLIKDLRKNEPYN